MTNYCRKCGAEIPPEAGFCQECGTEVRRSKSYGVASETESNTAPELPQDEPEHGMIAMGFNTARLIWSICTMYLIFSFIFSAIQIDWGNMGSEVPSELQALLIPVLATVGFSSDSDLGGALVIIAAVLGIVIAILGVFVSGIWVFMSAHFAPVEVSMSARRQLVTISPEMFPFGEVLYVFVPAVLVYIGWSLGMQFHDRTDEVILFRFTLGYAILVSIFLIITLGVNSVTGFIEVRWGSWIVRLLQVGVIYPAVFGYVGILLSGSD